MLETRVASLLFLPVGTPASTYEKSKAHSNGEEARCLHEPIVSPSVTIVPQRTFPLAAASAIADAIRVLGGQKISFAVSGGQTVVPIYQVLAKMDLPWGRTHLFQTDERAVEPTHQASNYRLIQETLVDNLPVPPVTFVRMEADLRDLDFAAQEYARQLPDRMDLVLLGIGEDGHICSIFPGQGGIWEAGDLAVPSQTPRGDMRLTLTPTYLERASTLVVVACGSRKAKAVGGALAEAGLTRACPARLARAGNWILDEEAARYVADPTSQN